MSATLLASLLSALGGILASIFERWFAAKQADTNTKDLGRAEVVVESEKRAREIQQEITDATASKPADRDDLARVVAAGGL